MHSIAIHHNSRAADRASYAFQGILSVGGAEAARSIISCCPHHAPTPLLQLSRLARATGVHRVFYKDEAPRFGLGSFKALGGAYAVAVLLARVVAERTGSDVSIAELVRGAFAEVTRQFTVACASDGNHGRSVAAGAQVFGCNCAIFLHEGVSAAREAAITALGASVIRTAGNYDDSVRAARTTARERGWEIVSDTTAPDDESTTAAAVMQGYTVLVLEVIDQLLAMNESMPTHVFLQGGVGGLAAAVVAHFWETLGKCAAPVFVIVEPERADCLFQSARVGAPTPAQGDLNTLMAGLSCGEVSHVAWPILQLGAEFFMTVPDEAAIECMRLLARGDDDDVPIVAGESAVAGLAGLLSITREGNTALRKKMKLDEHSRVLLIGTEGATDPQLYRRFVGAGALQAAACETQA